MCMWEGGGGEEGRGRRGKGREGEGDREEGHSVYGGAVTKNTDKYCDSLTLRECMSLWYSSSQCRVRA